MTDTDDRSCATCLHWFPDAMSARGVGSCRARPPIGVPDGERMRAHWPDTARDMVCGAHLCADDMPAPEPVEAVE